MPTPPVAELGVVRRLCTSPVERKPMNRIAERQRSDRPFVVAFVLLVAGPLCIAASFPWSIPLAFSGFSAIGLAFAIFAWRTFRASEHRTLAIVRGVLFVLLSLAAFTMSVLAPLGIAYNRP